MRILTFLSAACLLILFSCKNNEVTSDKPQWDTTCVKDPFKWEGEKAEKTYVSLSVKNCTADTLTWFHKSMDAPRMMHMGTLMGNLIRPTKDAIKCVFVDNKYAWLSLNDAITGRGYLMMMPFSKKESIRTMKSAINSFDKKFVLPDDLRAYCDYSNIFVEDINTGKKEQMSFKKEYKISWNNIHETIDSVNISKNRIFVQLIEDGKKVQLEKPINL